MIRRFCWIVLLFGCQPISNTEVKAKADATVAAKASNISNEVSHVKKSARLFDNRYPFEIFSFKSTLETSTTDKDTLKCRSWTLTKQHIIQIIKNSKSIDGTTWDLSFLVLACVKSVIVLQNGMQYPITINAGGYFWVSNGDTAVIYGDYKKSDRKYFITGPDTN